MGRILTSERHKDDGRLYFEDARDPDNVAVFFANRSGGLTVAVAQVEPVNSYNEVFECDITLPPEQAVQLRDYLNTHFPSAEKEQS